jgi:uncharacterized membrane protein
MKKITKISGIIGLLVILAALVVIIIAFNESNHSEEKLLIVSILIPLYFIAHFFIRYKFGFNSEVLISEKVEKLLYRGSFCITILILFIALILQTAYFLEAHTEAKLAEKYSGLKTWLPDTSSLGQIAELKTKFEDNKLYYNFSVVSDSVNKYKIRDITNYSIQFLDKDGFIAEEINLQNLTRKVDKDGEIIGYYSNSSEYIEIMNYSKFMSWEFTYRKD